MKFQFVEKRADITEDLREYARKKIGKLDKFFKKEAETQVLFSSEGNHCIVEVTVNNDSMFYRAREVSDDTHPAIDRIVSAIERQIRKNKTRLEKKLRQGAFDRGHAGPQEADEEPDFSIIRSKRFKLKPMTPEEAILQMNLLHHEFFVFRNFSGGGSFAVVYRRQGGGYGLIEEG